MHADKLSDMEIKEMTSGVTNPALWVDSPERKALELAHMMFGVEVEYFSNHQNAWRPRMLQSEGLPFHRSNAYRRLIK